MNQFKCKMCGAPIIVEDNQSTATCEYCMSIQTVPTFIDEPKIALLHNRANSLRLQNEFDKALANYENILIENPNDSEAHWGALLCRYGIEYVTDPKTGKKIPTCHRTQTKPIFDDIDYLGAINNASEEAKHLYQEEAETINQIQKGILSISVNEKPYDIFICYKETDESGSRTKDSVIAQEIYDELTKRKYKVFFSRITLESKLGTQYEPYIYAALNSSKVMLVVGTKPEYFNAVWVRNEWVRFLEFIANSSTKKYIIPCYKDMDAYELPNELLSFQSQNMDKLGFIQDLIRGIDKIFDRTETVVIKETQVIEAQSNSVNPSVDAMLRRSEIELSRGNTKKAQEVIDQALNLDPENAKAYLLLTIIDLGLTKAEDLVTLTKPLTENYNYNLALQFAKPEYKKILEEYNDIVLKRLEEALEEKYKKALELIEKGKYLEAKSILESIIDYKDCKDLIKDLEEKINIIVEEEQKRQRKNRITILTAAAILVCIIVLSITIHTVTTKSKYNRALGLYENGDYEEAISLLEELGDYADSRDYIELAKKEATVLLKESKYYLALERFNAHSYELAMNIFEELGGYKDSETYIKDSKYYLALEYFNDQSYEIAMNLFEELGDYKDSIVHLNYIKFKNNGWVIADDVAYFGIYPQVLVEDSSTITSLNELVTEPTTNNSYGWMDYEYYYNGSISSYMWYKDVELNSEKYRGVYFTSYRSNITTYSGGGNQVDNGYFANTIYWFKFEPIKWLILSEKNGKKLIIADLLLDSQDYNPSDTSSEYYHNGGTGYSNNYELSNIRKWLNDDFYNTAFNDLQKEMIITTNVDNSALSTGDSSNQYACNNKNDKLFLLSYDEAKNYFSSADTRKATGTDYAKCQGLWVVSNSYSFWLLRSPYNDDSRYVRSVYYDGDIDYGSAFETYSGVRPACWINVE